MPWMIRSCRNPVTMECWRSLLFARHFILRSCRFVIYNIVKYCNPTIYIMQFQVGLSSPIRLCQGHKIVLRVLRDTLPMQCDGEAWLQRKGTITISHKGTSTMLKRLEVESPEPRQGFFLWFISLKYLLECLYLASFVFSVQIPVCLKSHSVILSLML